MKCPTPRLRLIVHKARSELGPRGVGYAGVLPMVPTYRIKDWQLNFEKAQTRKVDKMQWVAIPNKHDGTGFRTLSELKNGIQIYGAWQLILQIASKCSPRGLLVDKEGKPLTSNEMRLKTGFPASVFENSFSDLINIGWLECLDQSGSAIPVGYQLGTSPLQLQDRTLQTGHYSADETLKNGRTIEQQDKDKDTTKAPQITLDRTKWRWEGITDEMRALWDKAYPNIHAQPELDKMLVWIESKNARKKNWKAFICNWLAKAQKDNAGRDRGPMLDRDGFPIRKLTPEELEELKQANQEIWEANHPNEVETTS